MKKLLIVCLMCIATLAMAQSVSESDALHYASSYAKKMIGQEIAGDNIKPVVINGKTVSYLIGLKGQGWVLVAADKRLNPIIGYSTESDLDADNMPDPMVSYVGQFADDMDYLSIEAPKSDRWATDTIAKANKSLDEVEPLITVKWNQSGLYRQFCPSNASVGDAIVGCVAVGLAQAMSYHQHPARPVGQHSYTSDNYGKISINYDNEPEYDWELILSGSDNKVSCARLLYHCGVAVDMDYGPDGSGVQYMGVVPYAAKTFFGYSNRAHNLLLKDYSVEEWESMLKEELRAGRPLIYSGYSESGGHCFNVDGYNSNGLFHFNWGWAGSGNGYFAIQSHTYNEGQRACFEFMPPTGEPTEIKLDKKSVQAGLPAGTVVANITVDCDVDNVEWQFEVLGAYNMMTESYSDPAFYIEDNQLKTLKELQTSARKTSETCNIIATNPSNNKSLKETFSIAITESSAIGDIVDDANISLYASNGRIVVGPTGTEYDLEVVSLNGASVAKTTTKAFGETAVSDLAKGFYIVSLTKDNKLYTHKITIK